jgi:hypothetical protein
MLLPFLFLYAGNFKTISVITPFLFGVSSCFFKSKALRISTKILFKFFLMCSFLLHPIIKKIPKSKRNVNKICVI